MQNNRQSLNNFPMRLDFGTKVSILATLLYVNSESMNVAQAVTCAIDFQQEVDRQVNAVKKQHKAERQ